MWKSFAKTTLFLFLTVPLGISAATLNVPADFATFQEAIEAAVDGDTVLVAPGTYYVQSNSPNAINFLSKNITVTSEQGPQVTIIDADLRPPRLVEGFGGSGGTFSGFTIKHSRSNSPGGAVVVGGTAIIENNIFRNNFGALGVILVGGGSPTIRNNIFHNNTNGALQTSTTHGVIQISNAVNPLIENNIFRNNEYQAISAFDSGSVTILNNLIYENSANGCGAGIRVEGASNVKIIQNLIYNNTATELVGGICARNSDNLKLLNNTIYLNTHTGPASTGATDVYFEPGSNATNEIINNIVVGTGVFPAIYCSDAGGGTAPIFSNNNVFTEIANNFDGACADQMGINGNISADSQFVDASNNLFYLQEGSLSVDFGLDSDPDTQQNDLYGQVRVLDGDSANGIAIDQGAIEYDSVGLFKFAQESIYTDENNTSFEVEICRYGSSQVASIDVLAASGSALLGTDFSFVNTTLIFNENELGCKNIPITLIDNNEIDLDKEFILSLNNPINGTLVVGNENTNIVIVDNETDINLTNIGSSTISISTSPADLDPFSTDRTNIDDGLVRVEVLERMTSPSKNLLVTVTMPPFLQVLSAGSQGLSVAVDRGCIVNENVAECSLSELLGGLRNLAVRVWGSTVAQGEIVVTASSEKNDIDLSNNILTIPVNVVERPVELSATEDDVRIFRNNIEIDNLSQVFIGDELLYVASCQNESGDEDALDVVLTFNLSEGITYIPRIDGCDASSDGRSVTCIRDSVPTLAGCGSSVRVRIDEPGDVSVSVSVDSFGAEVNPADNTFEFASLTAADPQKLFPLVPFINYEYLENNSLIFSRVVLGGTESSNGVEIFGILDSEGDTATYSNDSNGLIHYQELDSDGGSLTYDPPVKLLNAQPTIGDEIVNRGRVRIVLTGIGDFDLAYSYDTTVVGIESVAVPFGTFDATRVDASISISGSIGIPGVPFPVTLRITQQETSWLVSDIGVVKNNSTTTTVAGGPAEIETSNFELLSVGGPPELLSPLSGTVLSNNTATATWDNKGFQPTNWSIGVGSGGLGTFDLASSGVLPNSATSSTITGVPVDGSNVTLSLFVFFNRTWTPIDSVDVTTFTAAPPEITSPTGGPTLTNNSVTVTWDPMGTAPNNWSVGIGNNGVGSFNLASSGVLPASVTSATITGLPVDGSALTLSLFTFQGGVWTPVDSETVTAFTAPPPATPDITSPTGAPTLTDNSVTVTWDPMGTVPTNWSIGVGNNGVGSFNLGSSGVLSSAATSATIAGLPVDGSTMTISLFTNQGGVWSPVDSETVTAFTAPPPATPEIVAPLTGAILGSGTAFVQWNPMGTVPTNWSVGVGNNGVGSFNLGSSGVLPASAIDATITGLPVDGSALTLSLFTFQGGVWTPVDSETVTAFTAPPPATPDITSPIGGPTLTDNSVTVTWDPMGTVPTNWSIGVGSGGLGTFDIASSGVLPASATSATIIGLPVDGSALTLSLFTFQGGVWTPVDSETVTAFTVP